MTADRRAQRRAERHADRRTGRSAAGRRGARADRPLSHRRRPGFRGRRPLLATLLSVFLLVGVCAATGVAWDPFGGASVQGTAATDTGAPWPVGPLPDTTPEATVPAVPQPEQSPAPTAGTDTGNDAGAADAAPAGRPTGALPFDLPQPAALRSGDAGRKLVFAHYFTPYPLSLDNASADSDYYTRNYLKPDGESGKHERYGGLLRDRPLPVTPKNGSWELANLQQEVRTARAAGIDGFTLDMLSLSGKNWERSHLLMEAARSVDPAFKVMLMPDMTSLKTDDPGVLADAVAALGKTPAAHRLPDGRLVVSPFKAEEKSVAWWTSVMDILESRHGIRTAFVPLFLDFDGNSADFAPISHGFSEWGSRSYVGQEGSTRDVKRAHGLGKIWMQPVSVQDARPNQGIYDEAGNTATLRATWTRAIDDGADWVQLTTWNDYSEGSQFAPSLHNGHAYLDLTSFYLTRFKTGSWPKIVRDTLYLTARTQFASADPTGDQSLLMSLRKGSAAPRDTVEVLSFLVAPGDVRTAVGPVKASHRAPAGVHAELLPLKAGSSSARLVREGKARAEVELPQPVDPTVEIQDLQYQAATSGRDTP
ncbi:glycoside hydrolase family 71 protein [Streptomyces sp. cmx-4-9]|uniref:glycoside hydrolase family 71 protein n=1 Tax=Streptomyces sp. cmx-4-9 TaxID=2790941 RepID=UPI00398178E3